MSKNTLDDDSADATPKQREERKSGRATFDADGRSVWEWQVTTGVFTRTITEDQLLDLAQTNLELAQDPPRPVRTDDYADQARRNRAQHEFKRSPQRQSNAQGPVRRLLSRLVRSA